MRNPAIYYRCTYCIIGAVSQNDDSSPKYSVSHFLHCLLLLQASERAEDAPAPVGGRGLA
jgi:hypothetical protein